MLCLPVLFGLAAPAAAQTTPTISPSTLIETGVINVLGSSTGVLVSDIPADWTAPVTHTLTTTGTGTGHATLSAGACSVEDVFVISLDTYDLCDNQGAGYDADGNSYLLSLRASIDTHSDSGETFTVTLTDSSTPVNTLSFTMTINDPPPEISVSLPTSEGESRSDAGEKKVDEGDGGVGIGFNLAADKPLPSALTVCVRVTESGGDRVASGSEGIQTVNMPSSVTNGSGTHTLTWTNTAADDQDSSVTVEAVAPNTVGCSAANDSYTVSSSDASDKLLIQDDEDTTVELTSTDVTMTEGDASDTATLTVELSRQLYAGETIGVPIALASTTGARLPGSVDGGSTANHDFTVAAAAGSGHSGVTLAADAPAATPRLVFTGHDSNTVQTATVTLTPVANRDDPDATDETITATLTSPGLVDTTVSGGVTAHASNNAATLTLEDDEAAPAACSAQNTVFNETSLRVLESGETTYCVRLTTAPSGGDTTVTIGKTGRYPGAANASTTTLTFTSSNYQTPQQVTVTGVDQPNLHLNRSLWFTHTANGGGYSNSGLANVRVAVDDAPELEAWDLAVMNPNDYAAKQRPNTVKATRGFRYFQNDMTPIYPLRYQLRLSNRPATGETVTVTATSSDISKFGLSLTSGGTPQASLTVTFEDRPADRVCFNGGHSSLFDVYTSNPDASWACYRQIWVISTQQYSTFEKGCADITHTASGGGLRSTAIGTIRAHAVAGTVFAPYSAPGRDCPLITEELRNRSAPATAAPAPTEAVANLQVTAVDDASASVTWDAVEHATSYDVSWSAESSDSLNASAGAWPGITGTSTTIQHDASVSMTLTVTVTPEYVDENGDNQQLDSLAATATLEVGPQPLGGGGTNGGGDGGGVGAGEGDARASAIAACVSADLMQHVEARIEIAITDRWVRIRNALIGQPNAITLAEVKEIYENRKANGWDTNRLEEVIAAMECIESAMQQTPVPDATPDATPDPVPDPDPDSTPTPDPDPEPEPVACVSPQLRADAEAYSKETWRESADHVERWLRVLQTFSGTANDATVMTPTEAEEYVNRGWERWVPVLEALKCMEQQALDSG